jgi:hypothetical protein
MEKSNPSENKKKTHDTIEIPVEGSLGLLALGAVGLKAWRKKREEEQLKQKSK